MAWCPFAQKLELQPESDQQSAIRPTQFIVHSMAAPWTVQRLYEYWKSNSLESHFGLGYNGDLAQYIGTQTRADANAAANRRPDGSGAVSIETASNTSSTDPWTADQVDELIKLGAWLHERHGIPLRICRTHSDPGFGYHRLHAQWSLDGTACPGSTRIRQFREVVFPGIVARATGSTPVPEEDDMPITTDDVKKILTTDGIIDAPDPDAANEYWALASYIRNMYLAVRRTEKLVAAQNVTIAEMAKALAARNGTVDADALIDRIETAIEGVTVHLDVPDA